MIDYKRLHLVKVHPDSEWLLAIPKLEEEETFRVDIDKNLAFDHEISRGALTVKPAPGFNRLIPIELTYIPDILNVSQVGLLATMLLHQSFNEQQWNVSDENVKVLLLSIWDLQNKLGEALLRTLSEEPEREETPYIEHDFIAQQVRSWIELVTVDP